MVSESTTAAPSFAAWAGDVAELCATVDRLVPVAASLGAADPRATDWHGALFGKLRPQVARDPLLVAAVCGGTNTGKSLITNSLVGAEISRSVPEAARTLHPVASLPRGRRRADRPGGTVPGIPAGALAERARTRSTRLPSATSSCGARIRGARSRRGWSSSTRPTSTARSARTGTGPSSSATPATCSWPCSRSRSTTTRRCATSSPAAAAAGKTVIVVFNMVDWPRQRERIAGWLATFTAETGVAPAAVYAAPHDFAAAEAGRIDLHPLPEHTPDGRASRARRAAGGLRLRPHQAAGDGGGLAGGARSRARARRRGSTGSRRAAAGWRNAQRLLERRGPRPRGAAPASRARSSGTRSGAGSSRAARGIDLAVSGAYRRSAGA